MFDYVNGILAEKNPSRAVVEAAGVGYEILIPLSTYEKLPTTGAAAKLFTHHYVREDQQKLFGFATSAERETFRLLIGISNIGPKTALSVLSGIPLDDLARSVMMGDATRLRKIPGIGDKTAQRLVIELKGKLGKPGAVPRESGGAAVRGVSGGSMKSEAFEAMLSLGYNEKQVQAALQRVETAIQNDTPPADMPVEEWIRKALQVI